MNNRSGRPRSPGRRDQRQPQGNKKGNRSGPPRSRSDNQNRDRRRTSNERGGNNHRPGHGVEKPERHFGENARGSRWGGVARRGAHNASIDQGGPRPPSDDASPPPKRDDDVWRRVDKKSQAAQPRRRNQNVPSPELDPSQTKDLSKVERERLARNIATAGDHFLAERFGEVERITKQLLKKHPAIAEIHELHGLTLYRLGKWSDALERLEHFTRLTGDVDQFPVMADCHRALGEIESVRRLWNELRLAGPEPSILTEGRIVMAGALADTGDVPAGIRLLEKGPIKTKRARDYHVRLWYALADL